MKVRVYVGGLPPDVKVQELRERFGRFVRDCEGCELQQVDLPKPKQVLNGGAAAGSRGFAYLTLEGEDAQEQSEKLQKTYNRTKWRGSLLKVETAKPHFMEKLEQEWAEQRRQKEPKQVEKKETLPMKVGIKFLGKKKTSFQDVDVEMKPLDEQETVEAVETDTELSEREEEQGEMEDSDTESEEEALGEDDVEAFVRQMQAESESEQGDDVLAEDDVEAFVKQMEAENEEPKELTPEEANARRLAALEAKQQRKKQEKVVIPAVGESLGNKKITFDDSGNEEEPEEEGDKVVSNWMDSSDDEEEDTGARKTFDFAGEDDADAQAFALRPEFTGESGKKLFEMQKRFGGDTRFRLDARFLEGANEFDGIDDDDDVGEQDDEAIAELQNFLDEENPEEAARHAREMQEEEEAALRIISTMFPDVDVTRLQRRLQEQRHPKDPLKEAAWMGELKRYDPRDAHSRREFEIPMVSKTKERQDDTEISLPTREEKEIPTGGDRFFATSGSLGNMFSRVRKNSEDGEEGEAALDGVFKFGSSTTEAGDAAGAFKLSSLFSFPVGEDKPLAAMGEQLLEDEQEPPEDPSAWQLSTFSTEEPEDEAMATDSEDDGSDEETPTKAAPKRSKKSLEDFLTFGRTFVGGDEVTDWPERRKKLTLDYKRKRRDALKMKKRQNKHKAKADRKKPRL